MPRKESKYSKALGVFICDKIADGMTRKQIHEKYSEVPTPKTQITWMKKFPEFGIATKEAYGIQILNSMDEMKELSEELLRIDEELSAKIKSAQNSGNESEMKAALTDAKIYSAMLRDRRDNIRVRIDAIKFSLSKLAHIFLQEFKESPKTAVQISVPTVHLINYRDTIEVKQVEDK